MSDLVLAVCILKLTGRLLSSPGLVARKLKLTSSLPKDQHLCYAPGPLLIPSSKLASQTVAANAYEFGPVCASF